MWVEAVMKVMSITNLGSGVPNYIEFKIVIVGRFGSYNIYKVSS
jgi:hypothetical protein